MANVFLFVEYPTCSTCRKAKKWLDAQGVEFVDRHIVDDAPTAKELRAWSTLGNIPVRKLFNTSGKRYRERNIKDRLAAGMSDDEAFELLAQDGMLVKRPLLVGENVVFAGFREDQWREALG